MGYDTGTNYTYHFFSQLNPYGLRFNFLSQGLAFPKIDHNFTACELGFGNGLSIIMNKAATQAQWYGNDFNPSQVNYADLLAQHGAIKVHLSDDAFDEFLGRDDLPMFDYICLHGIWSWISPQNQDVIVEFVKNKLKVGGILYVSYNTTGYFDNLRPFRTILNSYIQTLGDPNKNSEEQLPDALAFIDKLLATKPAYIKKAPWAQESYKNLICQKDQRYVSHEYTNDYWFLENFDKVAHKFEQAKLSYVCQAKLVNNLNSYYLEPKQFEALKPFIGTPMYEQLRDFISRNNFRSDVYVKGAVKLSTKQQDKELDATYFICDKNLKHENFTAMIHGFDKKVDLKEIEPILGIFKDNKCHSYQELRTTLCSEQDNGTTTLTEDELFCKMVYAVSHGMLQVAVPPEQITKELVDRCLKLNYHLLGGNQNEDIRALVSPVLGGGVFVSDLDKVLLSIALKRKDLSTELITDIILEIRTSSNPDSSITSQESYDLAQKYAQEFMQFSLPLYRTLMVI